MAVAVPVSSILVGYDGTEHSDRALERAKEYGRALEVRLLVATVVYPRAHIAGAADVVAPVAIDDAVAEAQADADRVIARAALPRRVRDRNWP